MKTSLDITKETGYFFFVLSGALFLALIIGNGGAYAQMLQYLLIPASPVVTGTPPVITEEAAMNNTISALESAKPLASPKYIAATTPHAQTYKLTISRIGIATTVAIPKSTERQDVLASLKKGVGLYPASSLPGYPGRTIILGHSARPYAFTLLETTAVGDRISITEGGKEYLYEVFERNIISPQATDAILNGPLGAESELALITCWPTGNSAKRVLIRARLISP
ncbi:MAG: sortase [bacterium]|nr:sortase [bacterium]